MKRMTCSLIIIVLAVLWAVSCSPAPAATQAPAAAPTAAPVDTLAPAPTAASVDTPAPAPTEDPSAAPLKVLFFVNGSLDDKNYFGPIYQGILQAQQELGFESNFFEAGLDKGDYLPILEQVAGMADYDIMVLASQDMGKALNTVAPKFPGKKFILLDGPVDGFDNVFPVAIAIDAGSYLAGLYAGLMTGETTLQGINADNKVGVVGGMDMPFIKAYLEAFKAGAVAAGVPPENVLMGYAGDFGDPEKGKQAALPMYAGGADIVYQVAGGAGMGVFDAARESGAYAIGIDYDQALSLEPTNPDLARVILTSIQKDLTAAAYKAVSMAANGTLEYGQAASWGLAEGVVGLVKNKYYDEYTPDEVKAKIDQAEKDLQAGTLTVPAN